MADMFDFSDPNQMGLLGAIQGLGAAAMPSRLPVPLAAVLGQAAGGLQQGAMGAQAYKKAATENALQSLTLQGWQNYLGQAAPSGAAASGGTADGGATAPGAGGAVLPGRSPYGVPAGVGGMGVGGVGNPLVNLPAMWNRAQAGMFPGGPGASMFPAIASLAEKITGQGYQPVVTGDGSLGVAPLSGMDQVKYMLSRADSLGKTTGEKEQNIAGYDASGNPVIAPMAGSLQSAKDSAFATSQGTAQGALPSELQKIAATGAQTRQTEAYKTTLANQNDTVPVPDGQGGTRLMLKGDAKAIAAQNGTALPDTVNSSDLVSPSTGTIIPGAQNQIKTGLGASPNPEWVKQEQTWSSSLPSNYQTEQRLMTLGNALKKTQSGWGAPEKADVAAALKSLGINPPQNLGDPAAVQTVIHENMLATLGTLKDTMAGTGSRMTQMEFDRISKAMTNAGIQPEANLQILGEAVGTLRQNRAMINSWPEAKQSGWSNPYDYQQSWLSKNPIGTFVDKAKTDIGPLKGMKGGYSEGQTATNPKTGERMMFKNGQWVPM
jgi:hypothetical protein